MTSHFILAKEASPDTIRLSKEPKMALIDRIKFDGPASGSWLIHKINSEQLVSGTQLIVGQGQEAIFFRGGNPLDVFGPGTHTLATGNIPLLQRLVNLPFGGKTPFTAEVYFVNTTACLDLKWGTKDPFPVTEPRYGTIANVRAFGQFGLRVSDTRSLVAQLVGVVPGGKLSDYDVVVRYFKGLIVNRVKTRVAEKITRERISLFEITVMLEELSSVCAERIAVELNRFGVELVNFFFESINIPDEDLARLKGILENRAEFEILGDERYSRKRSFDFLETGAANPGTASELVRAGLGLGIGVGLGSTAGDLIRHVQVTPPTARPEHCGKCGAQTAPGSRFCSGCGEKQLSAAALCCPRCRAENTAGAKFCQACGASLAAPTCLTCGAVNSLGARFCAECGAKVGDAAA